jgi:hypothetical protein
LFFADDLYVKYDTTYDLVKMKDSQVYIVPKNYTVEFEPRDVKAKLENLFNGNKLLGELETCERQLCYVRVYEQLYTC